MRDKGREREREKDRITYLCRRDHYSSPVAALTEATITARRGGGCRKSAEEN